MSPKANRSNRKPRAAALLCGAACLSFVLVTQLAARPDMTDSTDVVRFLDTTPMDRSAADGSKAAARSFVQAMASGDEDALWTFASEEEHDAFQVKDAAFQAYAEEFPALTRAKEITVVRTWDEVETEFLALIVRDRNDRTYWAEIGLWLSDAGDWTVVSLDVKPTGDYVAGL